MNVINFLPRNYLQKQSRRQANKVCALVGLVGLLAVGGLLGIPYMQAVGVAETRRSVEQQYNVAAKKLDQLKQLEARKEGLLRKVDVSSDLLERVPRSFVLAHMVDLLPENTTVMLLRMTSKDVKVPLSAPTKTKKGKSPAPATKKVKVVGFRMHGLAPSDLHVSEFLASVSADPLFDDVNLERSEETVLETGVSMRKFEVVFTLSNRAKSLLENLPNNNTWVQRAKAGERPGGAS